MVSNTDMKYLMYAASEGKITSINEAWISSSSKWKNYGKEDTIIINVIRKMDLFLTRALVMQKLRLCVICFIIVAGRIHMENTVII